MQQATATPNTSAAATPSFAGLLAALTSPGDKTSSTARKEKPWEDDELADDIATLSYESALRAHSRYRSPASGFGDEPRSEHGSEHGDQLRGELGGELGGDENFLAQGASHLLEMLRQDGLASAQAVAEESRAEGLASTPATAPAAQPELSRPKLSCLERNLKDASITIRMSKAECAQLHRRAAEAGLTVSAYLRSCTFEAESLRAMVKDTMTQLRSASVQTNPAPVRDSWLRRLGQWMARLLNPWQGHPRVARA